MCVAPDALSIIDPPVANAVHGSDSRCIKGSFYSIAEPQRNLLMIRGKSEHARKRRDWDRAFNVKSFNDYDPTVWMYTQQPMDQVRANLGKQMNIARWLQFFALDVMTDLAFGRSFDSLKTGKASRIMEEVEVPVMVFGLFHYMPSVAHFFKLVLFMVAHKAKFDQYLDSWSKSARGWLMRSAMSSLGSSILTSKSRSRRCRWRRTSLATPC